MTELAPEIARLVEAAIVRSPYARLLGLGLDACAEDRVRVRMPFREELATVGDMVHGGALASLVDVAATAAFWASPRIPPGARGTTISVTVDYLAAARGCDLLAEARVRRRGGSISTGEVRVVDPDGGEVALALVTYKLAAPR